MLPFDSLSTEARKADVLPSLRPNSLVSVGKLADANYTTIFHPKGDGVTIHAKILSASRLTVSQFSKGGGSKWAVEIINTATTTS
jgi:hypothetical protein